MYEKKRSMQLSMNMVIVIILSLVVLGLGFFMVNKLMCGAIGGIEDINSAVEDQILDLYGSSEGIVIKESQNDVSKGVVYGVGFGIRDAEEFSDSLKYKVELDDIGTCTFSESQAQHYIILGRESNVIFDSDGNYFGLIKFDFPKEVSSCNLRYRISLYEGENVYDANIFDVKLSKKKALQNLCRG